MNKLRNDPGAEPISDEVTTEKVELGTSSAGSEAPSSGTTLSEKTWLLQRGLQGAGAMLLFLLAGGVSLSVILRVLGQGLVGIVELGAISMVVVTVLVVPAVTAADENFRVEIIDFFVSSETIRRLDFIGLSLQILVSVFITICAIDLFINDVTTATTLTGELAVPRMWLTLLVSLGFLAMVHALGVRLVRAIRGQAPVSTFVHQEQEV